MKKIALLYSLLIISSAVFAQNTDYKTFQKNGKLYVNKNIPVYFWVSTSADSNSNDILMQSQASKKYVNPMYFDTEGYNTLQTNTATDQKGNRLEHFTFKIYADGLPPIVKSKFLGRRKYIDGKFIYKKGLRVKLSANDDNSGVAKISYSINNADFEQYKSAVNFNSAGKFVFRYYAVDNTGNKTRIHTYRFSVK